MLVVGGLSAAAVLLVVVALVLTLTVFRPSEDPLAGSEHTPQSEAPEREPAGGEYVPDGEEESSEPDPEVTHIEAPTAPCEFLPQESTSPQSPGTRSSGDMSFTIPEGWSTDIDWGGTLPHATDVASAEKHIEQNYYSVAQIGQVDWSGADGGYPGAEDAAAAYVQCHLTRADGVQAYGENPEVTSYVSEAVEVDGQDGWMVRGVVEVAEDGQIATYTAVEIVAVVVETPSGPAVFKVATSADDPAMNADLESMVDSLSVA
ncbi:MAG TPA: hypothetical protein H9786_14975 [Candidatus Brachybacterium merdavium]|uniref:Uncharacterized protein n=1 Tax=Candidatus Brachybacterium merdavium TaxID=2838513 RepID=A0A9D2LGF1_9MICO|nr:hypothetical protein [Candidatus Brachybacterium merdavium]